VDVIQDVGAYAGFAAVVGLAVLAALYFSQARDVRRLREWAGRAPERAAEMAAQQAAAPEQAAQEATRPPPSGAVRPIPAAKPAEAKPGALPGKPAPAAATPAGKPAGDKPAPAGVPPVPATAAATAAKPAAAAGAATADGSATAAAPAKGAPSGPAPATPAAAPGTGKQGAPKPPDAPKEGDAPAQPKAPPVPTPGGAPSTPPARPKPPPVLPARPAPPVRSPAAASATAQSTAVLPASSTRLRDRARGGDGSDGLSARYIALIVAGVIVIGGGVAFGISQLGGDDGGTSTERADDNAPQAPINPSTVTVSVLNGTTVPGLAAQIGDEVESAGFQRGNVANALDQQRTTSVVLYAEGADGEAKLVARRLGINTVEPVDPDSQALGGNASVVVIVGADQTS
jgi:hypothetical protein